jgi:hypothetical protein
MATRAASIAAAAVVSLAASAASAGGLTDRMQAMRMTVVPVEGSPYKPLGTEHRLWTSVSPMDLDAVSSGDIVTLDQRDDQAPRVIVLNRAADEFGSRERSAAAH